MAASYLEEYRRKFGFLATHTDTQQDGEKSSKSDIDTLLSRYLTLEKFAASKAHTPNTEGLNMDSQEASSNGKEDLATHGDKIIGQHEPQLLTRSAKVSPSDESSDDAIGTGSDSETSETGCDVFNDMPSSPKSSSLSLHVNLQARNVRSENRKQKAQRRHSSPYGSQSKGTDSAVKKSEILRTVSLASCKSSDDLRTEHNSKCLNGRLHRNESTLSSISFESNASSNWSQSDAIEILSDSGHYADLTGSTLTLSQFQLDSDSQKDGESLRSWNNMNSPVCQSCSPQQPLENVVADQKSNTSCTKCKRRTERKDIIQEILDSEITYGQDLIVIKQQFYTSMCSTGLVTKDQLLTIFGNIDDLIAVNEKFIKQIREHLDSAIKSGDHSYSNAYIGRMICELSAMLLAFENYCLNYPNSLTLIEQLRKEKELFNLFLDVSQSENHLLRRMDLKSFLMKPIQRVMKYPLLLKRLHKATPTNHPDRDQIAKAVEKLNNILLHINAQSKLISNMLNGSVVANPGKKRTSFEIALIKLTVQAVGWRHDEIHYVISGKIGFLLSTDSQTSDKLKLLRFNNAYAVLISRGKDITIGNSQKRMAFPPKNSNITDAILLVIKKGSSRLSLMQDPYQIGKCILSRNSEYHDVFEIQNGVKDSITIRPVSNCETWYSNIRHFGLVLGGRNQRRRNAFPNIVLHG